MDHVAKALYYANHAEFPREGDPRPEITAALAQVHAMLAGVEKAHLANLIAAGYATDEALIRGGVVL